MPSYYIGLSIHGELEAYELNQYDEKVLLSRVPNQIIDSLETFISRGFIVKIKGNEIVLRNKRNNEAVSIVDPGKILSRPDFAKINKKIENNFVTSGYIYTEMRPRRKNKPKRSPYIGASIKRVGLVTIGGAIVINGLAYMLNHSHNDVIIDEKNKSRYNPVAFEMNIDDVKMTEMSPINTGNDNIKLIEIVDEPVLEAPVQVVKDIQKKIVNLDFNDYSDTQKATTTKEKYYDLICEIAPLYGIDSNLMLGLCTQEGTEHKPGINKGGAIGLTQIQASVWLDKDLNETYYILNTETGEYELHNFGRITLDDCNDLRMNIHIGCRILQNCLRTCNYNLTAALQMYNMGYNTLFSMIDSYAKSCGKTRKEVLNNPNDLGWMNYRKLKGDDGYAERVNSWIDKNDFTFTDVRDGSTINYAYTNQSEISR